MTARSPATHGNMADGVKMVNVGPFEVVGAGVLGLLAATVLMAITVLLLWATAMTVVAPAMAAVDATVRRRRRREWRRGVLDSWLTDPDGLPTPVGPDLPPVRGLSQVCCHGGGIDVAFIAAQLAPAVTDAGSVFTPMAMLHARLEPSTELELPPHPDSNIVVYVLAGHGIISSHGQAVRAGETAVLQPGTPVALAASPDRTTAPFEVLVLDQPTSDQPVTDQPVSGGGLVVTAFSAEMRHRLEGLQALTDDLPVPDAAAHPARHREPAPSAA